MDRVYGLIPRFCVLADVVVCDRSFEEYVANRERDEVQKLHDADKTEADEDAAYTANVACKKMRTVFITAPFLEKCVARRKLSSKSRFRIKFFFYLAADRGSTFYNVCNARCVLISALGFARKASALQKLHLKREKSIDFVFFFSHGQLSDNCRTREREREWRNISRTQTPTVGC